MVFGFDDAVRRTAFAGDVTGLVRGVRWVFGDKGGGWLLGKGGFLGGGGVGRGVFFGECVGGIEEFGERDRGDVQIDEIAFFVLHLCGFGGIVCKEGVCALWI